MSKITLENVALEILNGTYSCKYQDQHEAAALCRSAQAVIEAARDYDAAIFGSEEERMATAMLHHALAAHARNEQGTLEQP